MSPEQARGDAGVDERTDVYSLGCVLYECLTGRPPFAGDHAVAILAKILLEDACPIADIRPGVPAGLRAAVAAMMKRDLGGRLTTMGDVVSALDRAKQGPTEGTSDSSSTHGSVGRRERRLLTLIVVAAADPAGDDVPRLADRYHGVLLGMVQGSHVIVFEAHDSASDTAARAARCALELNGRIAEAGVAVVSDRAELDGGSVVGDVLERAVDLANSRLGGKVIIDDLTRSLLDDRFEAEGAESEATATLLSFAPERASVRRTVLGKATPFIGRVRELAQLRGIVESGIEEESACAVVVTAEAGVGKSRLRHELTKQLSEAHTLRQLIGRGDAVSDRVSFGIIARALRASAGISSGEPAQIQRAKIAELLPSSIEDSNTQIFLAELAGVPAAEPLNAALEGARQDPAMMRESIRSAWTTWLAAESTINPVLLVLGDLHWGDQASIDLVDHMLTQLAESPVVVLALARPQLEERFDEFWRGHDVTRIELKPLSAKASRKLVQRIAGESCSESVAGRIVDVAAGNAFFLEQLVRLAGSGEDESGELVLPESILAAARARLAQLDERGRRLLRAASVFGERFWSGGLQALLGDRTPQEIQATLEAVVDHEHVVARPTSAIAGNREFQFTHALVRDAVYASLTTDDRTLAHGLAANWLEAHADSEAFVLADHYRQAAEPRKAALWYGRAAGQSIDAFDLNEALEHVDRGLALGIDDERTNLLATRLEAQTLLGRFPDAIETALKVVPSLDANTATFWEAESQMIEAYGRIGDFDQVLELLERDLDVRPKDPEAFEPWLASCARGAMHLGKGRGSRIVRPYADRIDEAMEGKLDGFSVNTRLRWLMVKHEIADQMGDLGTCYRQLDEISELEGQLRGLSGKAVYGHGGHIFAQLGLNARAEEDWRAEFSFCSTRGMLQGAFVASAMLASLATRRGAWAEAAELCKRAQQFPTADPRMQGPLAGMQATWALREENLDEALRLAETSERHLSHARSLHPWGLVVLARVLLARGNPTKAMEKANEAIEIYDSLEGLSDFEGYTLSGYLECLLATGQEDKARSRAQEFKARLKQRCEWIDDPEIERCFLEEVPDNAELVRLCVALTGAGLEGRC
jgi:tetratricopeptide (TPR) repeat protein